MISPLAKIDFKANNSQCELRVKIGVRGLSFSSKNLIRG